MKEKSQFFLTDTHAHLSSSRFAGIQEPLIMRAAEHGVTRIISISCDLEDSQSNLELAETFSSVFPTVGIHPMYVHQIPDDDWLARLRLFALCPCVAAIGEIGLDYYHPPSDGSSERDWRYRQRDFFEKQLQLALDLHLPVVIHQRESSKDVMDVLGNFPEVNAVLHCFNGPPKEAEAAIEKGHFLSFTGVLTFKNGDEVRKSASIIPLDRIMVETDAPYLAPVPFRGKPCEPYMVKNTAEVLAELRGISLEEIAAITSRNAEAFFHLEMR